MRRLLAAALTAAALAACDGSSTTVAPAAPATHASGVNFTVFTEELVRSKSDTTQPVAVDGVEFVFPDDDNPQAFAGVLPVT
jgi:hypothetical protein